MDKVYVLHRNIEFEFGEVLGAYLTKDAAVTAVLSRPGYETDGEFEISCWSPSGASDELDCVLVWRLSEGVIEDVIEAIDG